MAQFQHFHGEKKKKKKKKCYRFKIVLLGDSSVGKTSLASCFSGQAFSDRAVPTVAAAFTTASIQVDEETTFNLEVWDTAGQERYRSLTPLYYRGAKAAFVIYNITDPTSFQGAKRWIAELRSAASSDLVIVLLGNKCDLRGYDNVSECVPADDANAYAEEEGIAFLEVSAKVNYNIENSLRALCTGRSEDKPFGNVDRGGLYQSLEIHECGAPGSPLKRHSATATVEIAHRLARVNARIEYFSHSDLPCEGSLVHRIDPRGVLTELTVNINDKIYRANIFESTALKALPDRDDSAFSQPIFLVTIDPERHSFHCSLGLFPARQKAVISYSYVVYLPAEQLGQQSLLSFVLHDPVFDNTSKITCLVRSPVEIESIEATVELEPLTRAFGHSLVNVAHFSSPSLANLLATQPLSRRSHSILLASDWSASSLSSSSSSTSSSLSSSASSLLSSSTGDHMQKHQLQRPREQPVEEGLSSKEEEDQRSSSSSSKADDEEEEGGAADDNEDGGGGNGEENVSSSTANTWLVVQTKPVEEGVESVVQRPLFHLWIYYRDEPLSFRLAEVDKQMDTCIVFESTYLPIPQEPVLPLPHFVFLVDMNSSILPTVWRQIRRALQIAVHSLTPGCAFNVVGFGSCTEKLFEDVVEWNEANLLQATETLQKWNPQLGDPDLLPVIESLFDSLPSAFVFIISDGQPSNIPEILQVIESYSGSIQVFATGASTAASRGFLESVAAAGRGWASLAFDQDSLTTRLQEQIRFCLYPPSDHELPALPTQVLRQIPRTRSHTCGSSSFGFSFIEPSALPGLNIETKPTPTRSDKDYWFHKYSVYHMFSDLLGKNPSKSTLVRVARLSQQYGIACANLTSFGLVESSDAELSSPRYFLHKLGTSLALDAKSRGTVSKKVERKGLVDFLDEMQPILTPGGNNKTSRGLELLPSSDDNNGETIVTAASTLAARPTKSSCCGGPAPAETKPSRTIRADSELPEWVDQVSTSDDEFDGGFGTAFDLRRSQLDEEDRATRLGTIRDTTATTTGSTSSVQLGRSPELVADLIINRVPQPSTYLFEMCNYPNLLSQLACFQLSQGNWPVSNVIVDVLRLDLVQLEQMLKIAGAQYSLVNDVWLTALAVCFLQVTAPRAYSQWQLMAQKAIAFLATSPAAEQFSPAKWLQMGRAAIARCVLQTELCIYGAEQVSNAQTSRGPLV